MKTIRLTYKQESTLRDNRHAEIRIKRNHSIMYISRNFNEETTEQKPYIAREWCGNELQVRVKGNFED